MPLVWGDTNIYYGDKIRLVAVSLLPNTKISSINYAGYIGSFNTFRAPNAHRTITLLNLDSMYYNGSNALYLLVTGDIEIRTRTARVTSA